MKTLLVFLAVIGVSLCAPNPHGLLKHKIDKAPTVHISHRSLIDDLLDFLALLPIDDMSNITNDHLQTDGAMAAAVQYLQGPEWANLVDEVGSKQAVQDFMQYLTDAGLPVTEMLDWLHNLIANAVPGTEPDENGSLRPLLDEIEGILPMTELSDMLNEKMQNSPDFQDLYTEISSEDAHALVEEVRAIPEVQRLAQRLRDFGVRIDDVLKILYEWLGWGEPKHF